MDIQFVTDKQWDGLAHRLEKINIRIWGQSLSATGIAREASSFIVEIQSDKKGMLVKDGWREAMKQTASYNKKMNLTFGTISLRAPSRSSSVATPLQGKLF